MEVASIPQSPVGAGLLAKAVDQLASTLNVLPPSRANPAASQIHDPVPVFNALEIASPSLVTWGALTSVVWVPGNAVTLT